MDPLPQRAQPSCLVVKIEFGTLSRLPVISRRKVRMTSSHHAPYALGDTRATMDGTKDRDPARAATRLHEAGIASNRRVRVDVEGPVVGGYPNTLILTQSQIEKDMLCGESGRRS
ncbi:hypothetical protein V8G54_026216 [Vigna mungo]|uniref:Uncharacterized protein n=1 Tax=Vigna mungo TaxID=3915 RepID=A0AAQ3MZU9_VIGMU